MLTTLISMLMLSAAAEADSQSQGSCMMQRNFGTKSQPFSERQQKCIADYAWEVRSVIWDYDLSQRRFGGKRSAWRGEPPVLGAGFGTTATRSLAAFGRQLGLKVHHYDLLDPPHYIWRELDGNLTQSCSERSQLNQVNFQELLQQGHHLFLDTPLGEIFLDFYAASPDSKVILTDRDPMEWAVARKEYRPMMPLPVQSPCGKSLDNITAEDAAHLFRLHRNLVRCVVPSDKLLEINAFSGNVNTNLVARFLGLPKPAHYVPFPIVSGKTYTRLEESPIEKALVVNRKILPICITGQIRRLELYSKVEHVIKPAAAAGYQVQVYLVLDPRNDTKYIHRGAGEQYGNFTVLDGYFSSLNDTIAEFPQHVSVIFDPYVPTDHKVDPRYGRELSGEVLNATTLAYGAARSQSHVRQWGAMNRCWDLMSSISTEIPMAIRFRDDDAVLADMVPADLAPGVHVPNCATYRGANDKVAIVFGPGEVKRYFTFPLRFMRHNFQALLNIQRQRTAAPMNPESVVKNSMMLARVSIHQLDALSAPVVPSKLLTDGHKDYACYYQDLHYVPCIKKEIWDELMVSGTRVYSGTRLSFLCRDAPHRHAPSQIST